MSQIDKTFIYDDKGIVANWIKPFKRKDRFPLDKTVVFGSYSEALDYANNGPTSYVGQIISVVESKEGIYDVSCYKLIPSSKEGEYATLEKFGDVNEIVNQINSLTERIETLEGIIKNVITTENISRYAVTGIGSTSDDITFGENKEWESDKKTYKGDVILTLSNISNISHGDSNSIENIE